MAKKHGKNGLVKVGSNTVLEVISWNLSDEVEVTDAPAMGNTYMERLASGNIGQSGTITVHHDPDDTNGQGALVPGATVVLNLFDDGDATGKKYDGGNAIITSRAKNVSYNGIVGKEYNFVNADKNGITEQTVA